MLTRPSLTTILKRPLVIGVGPLAAAALAAGLLASSDGIAAAAPKPTVAQVRHRLEQLNSRSDALDQQYDQALQSLASARTRLRHVSRDAARFQAQFRSERVLAGRIAANAYINGAAMSSAALLTSGSAQQMLSKSSILEEMSASNKAQLEKFVTTARRMTAAKQSAQHVQAGIVAIKRKLAGQRASLRKMITRQKSLLAKLTAAQQAGTGPGGSTSTGTGGSGGSGGSGGGGSAPTGPSKTAAQKAVAFAYAQIGKPYAWGATGPNSYDCSGLVMAAWASAGVTIPRDTYEQWSGLPHVSKSQVQPGDLILYDSEGHVAMYVGGGYIIDAPHSGADVEKVAMSGWYGLANADGVVRP